MLCCELQVKVTIIRITVMMLATVLLIYVILGHYVEPSYYFLKPFIPCCVLLLKGKAVPLHAMEALGGRGGIAPTHSRPRH
jgi:hypothetical protein